MERFCLGLGIITVITIDIIMTIVTVTTLTAIVTVIAVIQGVVYGSTEHALANKEHKNLMYSRGNTGEP